MDIFLTEKRKEQLVKPPVCIELYSSGSGVNFLFYFIIIRHDQQSLR